MSRNKLIDLYHEVSDEYNLTPLAIEHGWHYTPTEFGLIEVEKVSEYFSKNGVFLDIGTGKGIVPRFAKRIGGRIVSLDFQASAGCSAIENVIMAGIEGYFCDISAEKIPLADGSVDCVFFGDVIEHLIHSPKSALKEIYRILKPNGVCIATTPNAMRLTVRIKVLLGKSNWHNIDEYFNSDVHYGHHHEYTPREFRSVFLNTGFRIKEYIAFEENLRSSKMKSLSDIKTRGRSQDRFSEAWYIKMGKKIPLMMTDLLPGLRSNMLVVAEKPALDIT